MGTSAGTAEVIDPPLMVVTVEVRERGGQWMVGARFESSVQGLPVPELLELVAETVDELWAANSVGGWWSGQWRGGEEGASTQP
jgi:hypothetical protein